MPTPEQSGIPDDTEIRLRRLAHDFYGKNADLSRVDSLDFMKRLEQEEQLRGLIRGIQAKVGISVEQVLKSVERMSRQQKRKRKRRKQ